MTKELPHAIAPDGVVIQLKVIHHSKVRDVCELCYMEKACTRDDGDEGDAHCERLLGVACIDYDVDEGEELAYWSKV